MSSNAMRLHRLPESGHDGGMGWRARLQAAKKILWGRWWFRVALSAWVVVSGYDTFSGAVSQVLPKYELTPLGSLVMGGSHVLPWWGWLLVLYGLVSLSLFEYVVRHVEALRPVPVGGLARTPLPPPTPHETVRSWITPWEAVRLYLHAYYWKAIQDAQDEWERRHDRAAAALKMWQQDPDNRDFEHDHAALARAEGAQDSIRATAKRIATSALHDALKDGALLGRGVAMSRLPVEEVDIPPAHWRVMSFNPDTEDAGGGPNLRYGGVRIGFPNRPSADARLPEPSDTELETPR